MKKWIAVVFILLGVVFGITPVKAATLCGSAAKQKYAVAGHEMQYCGNNSLWEGIINSTRGACAAGLEGKQRFNANEMQYCNGTNWISMNSCTTDTTNGCTSAGRQIFTAGGYHALYCDGTNWKIIAGPGGCTTSIPCDEFNYISGSTCVDAGCYYSAGTCSATPPAVVCTDYINQPTCESHPTECMWNGSSCEINNGSI